MERVSEGAFRRFECNSTVIIYLLPTSITRQNLDVGDELVSVNLDYHRRTLRTFDHSGRLRRHERVRAESIDREASIKVGIHSSNGFPSGKSVLGKLILSNPRMVSGVAMPR